jgi:hypothetical protein
MDLSIILENIGQYVEGLKDHPNPGLPLLLLGLMIAVTAGGPADNSKNVSRYRPRSGPLSTFSGAPRCWSRCS